MNRKTLVAAAVAGALGLAVVATPALASALVSSAQTSTSAVVPGGIVTDAVAAQDPLADRKQVLRATVETEAPAAASPIPPSPEPVIEEVDEPAESDGEHAVDPAPAVAPPTSEDDDDRWGSWRDRDWSSWREWAGERWDEWSEWAEDGPTRVDPSDPHHPSDDDRQRHDDRDDDDDDRRDDDGWSR